MIYNAQRKPCTILVIDDNPVVLEVTRAALELGGFRAITQERATGAIVSILQERPDLVLLDVNMPDMSSDSLIDILARTRRARGTLIVLYSSLPTNVLRMKVQATGAQGFIQKTAMQGDLVRQVRAFLKEGGSLGAMLAERSIADTPGLSSAALRAAVAIDDPPASSRASSGAFPAAVPLAISSLPVPSKSVAPSASAPPARAESGTLRLTLPTTLFLDDDLAVLTGYRRALSSEEVTGEYLTSGEQALRRISALEPPDVVVTDLVMPGMNGMDLYRRALELDPTWRHRFVFVTGAVKRADVAEFLLGVRGRALEKPVDMRRLRDAIRYAATGARIFRKQGSLA